MHWRKLMKFAAAAATASLSFCCAPEVTPGGLHYIVHSGLEPPDNLDGQLDAAWRRVGHVLNTGQCVELALEQRAKLHSRALVAVESWPLLQDGRVVWGLTWAGGISEVGLYRGRVPGLTHELWHQVVDATGYGADPNHLAPCWGSVGGDTSD